MTKNDMICELLKHRLIARIHNGKGNGGNSVRGQYCDRSYRFDIKADPDSRSNGTVEITDEKTGHTQWVNFKFTANDSDELDHVVSDCIFDMGIMHYAETHA